MRVEWSATVWADIYYNALNGRTDDALMAENHRVFGMDNLREWHCHPLGDATSHVPCEAPEIDDALRDMARIIEIHYSGTSDGEET
ncbi:MAG: hypothetical protein COS85_12175 [Armatimonadetes bacterium CG07_land_8_20_14_0_80_59_28]|nr:MAG: hypothetical protein COS85_12175 [Armatimonadetes bacterium CG07_land_8_20_14_0_80_59_28]PIX43808.1 MAG: hypothetical protein COZ56_06285 [Armatimonadetes bacterium CG_4_8_14_3_um_filter_58_9]PIY49150.1 MAG: hypothetical protein COZ05_01140 [Armatimonadetes bacterium CG_4_10_14_3_um_filter_59_10]